MKDIMEPPKTLEEQKKEAKEAALAAGAEVIDEKQKEGTRKKTGRPNRYQSMGNLELLCAFETCAVKTFYYPKNKKREEEFLKSLREMCNRLNIDYEEMLKYRVEH